MYRGYWLSSILILALFTYAQYQGWSLGGDDNSSSPGRRGGSGGGYSIFHK